MAPIPFADEHLAYLRDNSVGATMAKFLHNTTIN